VSINSNTKQQQNWRTAGHKVNTNSLRLHWEPQWGMNPNTMQQQSWRTVGHKVHTYFSRSHWEDRMLGVISENLNEVWIQI